MKPATFDQRLAQGLQLQQSGQTHEASRVYESLLRAVPDHPDVLHLSGLLASQAGNDAVALERVWQSTALSPENTVFLGNFGLILSRLGRTEHAIAVFQRSLAIEPRQAETEYNLGNVLRTAKEPAGAVAAYRRAIALKPDYARAMLNLAHLLEEQGVFGEAEHWLRQALSINPEYVNALNNLGNLVRQTGRPHEAVQLLQKVLSIDPQFARGWNNLASALRETGQTAQAIVAYQQALTLRPDYPEARMNMGMAMLGAGDYRNGWREFECRWQAASELQGYARNFPVSQWRGEPVAGKRVLVHAEQGFGDALQFFRYVPLLRDLGADVIVEAHPELVRLFQLTPGLRAILPRGAPLPAVDLHCPFMSLPLAFDTTLDTVPSTMPFLHYSADDYLRWQDWLGPRRKPRIGVVWKGNPRKHDPSSNLIDRRRSLPLHQLGFLFGMTKTIEWICLQKGHAEKLPEHMRDPTGLISDFADSAALVAQLDLVITVDTSMAHLAGGLAVPVWMLSRFDACWRWGDVGDQSPWYPSMRIFRQQRYGDWTAPLDELRQALAGMAKLP